MEHYFHRSSPKSRNYAPPSLQEKEKEKAFATTQEKGRELKVKPQRVKGQK